MTQSTASLAPGVATSAPARRRNGFLVPVLATQLVILAVLFGAWEAAVRTGAVSGFLFGSPAGVVQAAWKLILSGELWEHANYTLWASAAGFVVGTVVGTIPGLALWYSPYGAKVVEPFLVAINSVPKIAFAPLVILWFGTGLISKVALSISLTSIVALLAAFQAAKDADPDIQKMLVSLGATKRQIFAKVVVPSALPAIIATFRINIGFALVGTVVGEFISSKYGLGHIIFVASSLYDLNTVWVGIFSLMALGFVLYAGVDVAEKRLLRWKDQTYATQFKL
ncbi:Riboflavin transport system permease protein RibX [Achromobacter mucicolens]|uniref:ABC transporter permease n=1 Tax=Achromobacter mucicolens TaxID=1389922 RepID=UPI0009D42E71|nr:ABC transporter permease [Achromobacter mucicolens]MDG9968165.1 ABC transporter permease [Achromobacter mucicolens]OXC89679.1 ABC transporter permease [Achromobacter sp. KAs 3-5]CAB3634733.1 Riboflavin transport system permease protein RibX [Achromobacter mucicolens]